MKKSLIILFVIALVYLCFRLFAQPFFQTYSSIGVALSVIYMWIPGIIALVYAKKEDLKLTVFAKLNKSYFTGILISFLVCGVAFAIYSFFQTGIQASPIFLNRPLWSQIGIGFVLFLVNYLAMTFIISFIFLGGELYWRGYLWEKLKDHGPGRAIFLITVFSIFWQVPAAFYSPYSDMTSPWLNVLSTTVISFVVAPFLFFFREKGKAIYMSALVAGALASAYVFFVIIFPTPTIHPFSIYGPLILIGILVSNLCLKVYSPKTWIESAKK